MEYLESIYESMTPEYFESIYERLSFIEDHTYRPQITQLKQDVRIMEVFCMWVETWKYSIDEENEEGMERLTSVIAALKVIWPKHFTLLSPYLVETRDIHDEDVDSEMFELEGFILQSKKQVEGWCRYLILHSSMIQFKSKEFQEMSNFLLRIQSSLNVFWYRTAAIDPLGKQIKLLKDKIDFLSFGNFPQHGKEFHELMDFMQCPEPEGKDINEFLNLIGDFSNSAALCTCLYMVKKYEDEAESEMNTVLFDMLQKLIPYAYDITPLYVGFLKDYNMQPMSNSFLLGEVVESVVDFFFDHLAIVLKDDFLFLRDRLMFLFTFLTDPPCENAEEEEDLIRSQIRAILHHDVYLLQSFDEMNKDFSGEKALFSGFMIRIDKVNDKIRQLYRGSSYSWITLEVEKMEYDYFVSLHRELSSIEKHAKGANMKQIQLYKMELKFLRVFLLWLGTWEDTDEEIKVKSTCIITSFRGIWGEKEEEEGLLAHRLHAISDWHPLLAFELQGKIQRSKLETEAWCVNLFHLSFQFNTSTSYKIREFLDSILDNLNDLVSNKAIKIVPFKKQIETLEEKLILLRNFLKLAVNCKYYEELGEFKTFVQAFANDAACLIFDCWRKDANAESASEKNSILSHMLQKIKPATPDVARLYFGTLMAIYVQRSDSHSFGQTVVSFVHLFLEDLVTHLKDDDFQILQDNIVFLLTFLNDPPNQNVEDSICIQIDVHFWDGLYNLMPFDDMEGGFSNKKVLLSDFMTKIEAINARIRCIYGKFPDSSQYNFPEVISPQFLDFILQNIRNLKDRMNSDRKFVPFAKYKIIKIEEELCSLCPFFIQFFNVKSELNETWLELVDVLHLTENVIMSCISSWFVFDHPLWYHMAYLSNVFDEIKVVKANLEMIKLENIINNARCLPSSDGFISELAEHDSPSKINEIVVGFEDEKEKIIGMLTTGPKSLDIVSVVGMGGLGKTTLAKKVFGSSSVKCHFDVFAFCSVSLDHNTRRLLLDIIRDIKGGDDMIRDMTNDDLAHQLWKCLSRQTYLVVLDDIWNVSAWNEVKSSFPDHENGSRVMLTTRSREVADKCKIHCIPHQLRFLNDDESWEILQKKVFYNDISPPLCEIGKQIAKNCKGLALAVVVIGGLLARTEKSQKWWSEVEQRLAYYLSDEGCMEILELSYKHLPENLKPCLIYLGAFPEDMPICVKRVIMLWIAEGFVQESKTKSLEDVAKEYLQDLVDRSFIIISERSSSGGIKNFHVHDLIHELCQTKCRDGNFFQLNHHIASSSSSNLLINNHYRVSIKKESDVTNAAGSPLSNAHTIHFFRDDPYVRPSEFPFGKLRLVQVLDSNIVWDGNDIKQLTCMIHLRNIDAFLKLSDRDSIPSSISNLWNITSLTLRLDFCDGDTDYLLYTFWRMKSLRYVKVDPFILKFSDDDDDEHEAPYLPSDEIMDKVVSFSRPVLSTGKDVKRLIRRLPVVRKLSCIIEESAVYDEESIETLDFDRELESLKLTQFRTPDRVLSLRQYLINFPSTLRKLTLKRFWLPWTALSSIAELHCLEVLKLRHNSFGEPNKLETEDLVFRNLKFFQLYDYNMEEWNASPDSFPCLEQLVIRLPELEELPSCFGEMSTLKRIVIHYVSPKVEKSALRIQQELMELGIQLQLPT